MKRDTHQCECGEWSGERCSWDGPLDDTVVVEYMPNWLRASHVAARNAGSYPANGAERIRVNVECADLMLGADPDWCALVGEVEAR